MSAPAPPQTGQSPSQTPADTETSGGAETKENTGLDVTLLVFIIIIAVLILGVMVILLVYWCCRPGRQQEREEERQQINNIEKTAGELEREVTRAGLGLAGVEQTVARLEQRVESSSAGQQTADKTQVQSGALPLVQICSDTVVSLVEPYYAGAKVYAITTHLKANKDSVCCYGMIICREIIYHSGPYMP